MYFFGCFCHALFQHEMGVGFIAQKVGTLKPEFCYFQYIFLIVQLIVMETFAAKSQGKFLAQFPVIGIFHEGNVAGIIQGNHPTFFFSFVQGPLCGGFLFTIG